MHYFFIRCSLALLVACCFTSGCSNKEESNRAITFNGLTMGTTYNIKINNYPDVLDYVPIKNEIDKILNQVNQQMSTYQEDSELSLLNQTNSTEWQDISGDLYDVITTAIKISQLSHGAFDVTVGPLVNLWGFGPRGEPEIIPSESTIQSMLKNVGYSFLHTHKSLPALKKDIEYLYIDLSGIAKGFAVDKVALFLEQLEIRDYMIEIGGEIKAKGVNPKGKFWTIGIEAPINNKRLVQHIVALENNSIATSGDYRNYFENNGTRYSHIINPVTGKPITHNLASVTVIHSSTMIADALATAMLVMGPDSGMQLAKQENMAVLFITKEKNGFIEQMTDTFKTLIQ